MSSIPCTAVHTPHVSTIVAVIHGSRREPRVSFVIPPGAPFQFSSNVKSHSVYVPHTTYMHPSAGLIEGSYCTTMVTRAQLDRCIIDTTSATAGTDLEGLSDARELFRPIAYLDGDELALYPRLGGYAEAKNFIPAGARWVKGEGHWRAPLTSVVSASGVSVAGVALAHSNILELAKKRGSGGLDATTTKHASTLGRATDIADVHDTYARLAKSVGDIPKWFGMDLFAYQKPAALALAAGFGILGDEPGTGKTVMALAAAAVLKPYRMIVVTPDVAFTHWIREIERTGIIDHMHDTDQARIVPITSKRKQPPLPTTGVVVVTASLIRARHELLDDLVHFSPDILIFDEAHQVKTWESKVSTAMRTLARSSARTFCLTGTPIIASPQDAMVMLDMVGALDRVFGGFGAFTERYLMEDRYGKLRPRKRMLKDFAERMNENVWIRRTKAQIQHDLPPKVRSALFVDVHPSALVKAHARVLETITAWLDDFENNYDRLPSPEEITTYARANIALSSPLREAAGLAKIPHAVSYISEWVRSSGYGNDGWVRPLIVWAHHKVVQSALIEALEKAKIPYGAITGGLGAEKIGDIGARFQAGEYPVLVCSIMAASTGITLTRATDVLFVETDWTNANISQAESRAHRTGQDAPVSIHTMIAPGTLDVPIQSILRKKAHDLSAITPGADVNVAVLAEGEEIPALTPQIAHISEPSDIIRALVEEAMRSLGGSTP